MVVVVVVELVTVTLVTEVRLVYTCWDRKTVLGLAGPESRPATFPHWDPSEHAAGVLIWVPSALV